MKVDHEHFMRRCLELATMARDQGNTPVGSVVVLDGAIIGEGIEALPTGSSITGHAETLACQAALDATGRRVLAGAVLYTTAEPCFMCAYAIRQLRIPAHGPQPKLRPDVCDACERLVYAACGGTRLIA